MLGKPTMMFIDAQNLHHGSKNYDPDLEIDATALCNELTEGYDLIRAYWFDSYPTEEQIEQIEADEDDDRSLQSKDDFFYFLEMNGFRVEAKPLRMRDNGRFIEKGADIGLATELIAQGFTDSYDVAIVITGDADFIRSIEYVQDQGKIVKIASFESQISGDLKRTSDEYISLNDIAGEIRR